MVDWLIIMTYNLALWCGLIYVVLIIVGAVFALEAHMEDFHLIIE